MYILDSNALRDFAFGEQKVANRVFTNLPQVFLSTVVVEELLTGMMSSINRARTPRNSLSLVQAHQNLADALEATRPFTVLVYSDAAERVFKTFSPSILRVGSQDCRIAAQALAHNMTIITRNVRDFEAIGAACEDWSL